MLLTLLEIIDDIFLKVILDGDCKIIMIKTWCGTVKMKGVFYKQTKAVLFETHMKNVFWT